MAMQSNLLRKLEARPYRVADELTVHPDTVFRWIAYLKGGYFKYRPCRPHKNMIPRLARALGLPDSEVENAFSQRDGDE